MSDVAVMGVAGELSRRCWYLFKKSGCGCSCSPTRLPSERCFSLIPCSRSRPQTAYPISLREHSQRYGDDGVSAYQFSNHGAGGAGVSIQKCQSAALMAAGHYGLRRGIHCSARERVVEPDCRGADPAYP